MLPWGGEPRFRLLQGRQKTKTDWVCATDIEKKKKKSRAGRWEGPNFSVTKSKELKGGSKKNFYQQVPRKYDVWARTLRGLGASQDFKKGSRKMGALNGSAEWGPDLDGGGSAKRRR